MAVVNNAILDGLRVSIRGEFSTAFSEAKAKSFYDKVATTVSSTSDSNVYGFLGDFPSFRKWIGERVVKNIKENAYSLRNETYESTLGVKRTDIEDDNLGQYRTLAKLEGQEADSFLNREIAKLLLEGDKTLCFDGQNFFDTEHPVNKEKDGSGANDLVSNIHGAGGGAKWYLLSLDKVLKPLILQNRTNMEMTNMTKADDTNVFMLDQYLYGIRWRGAFGYGLWQQAVMSGENLDATNFEAAYALMESFKRDGGEPMGITPSALVVPSSLRSKAEALINVPTNAAGAVNINYKKVEVIVCPYLA